MTCWQMRVSMLHGLIRAAFEDKISSIVAGPNCRTRSLLRHVPVPGQPNAPRPIRRCTGEEFRVADATEEETQKLHANDIMMLRCIFLFMLSTYMRRARRMNDWVAFGLEQPASPKDYMVSFWDTKEWKAISEEFELEETTFKQGTMGGASPKPTTFGGNLELNECLPEEEFWRTSQCFKLLGFVKMGPWRDGYGVYGIDSTSVPVWCDMQGYDVGGAFGVQAHPIPT